MEDNIQTIVIFIVSVFILFIFPVYMAYEKKDDISYALAMRYTQDIVEEVRDKGYITREMYEDYRARLKVTGNSYDIQLTHEYNRYDPITNYYKIKDGKYLLLKTSTLEQRQEDELELINQAIENRALAENANEQEMEEYIKQYYKDNEIIVEDTYQLSTQVYTTEHILSVLNSERKLLLNSNSETIKCSDNPESEDGCKYAYVMNVDDNFNITIKNTNTTLATVIYNMVTANTLDKNTRIYVNYGGTILSSKWYGSIDYTKMNHDNITLDKFLVAEIFTTERKYNKEKEIDEQLIEQIYGKAEEYTKEYDKEYAVEFDVKPNDVTALREKGNNNGTTSPVASYAGYNFAVGNHKRLNENSSLSASIGFNGITLINNISEKLNVDNVSVDLPNYTYSEEKTRPVMVEYTYVDEETGEEKIGQREELETYIEYLTAQRKITDYSKIRVRYDSGKVKIHLTGKGSVKSETLEITVSKNKALLQGLDVTINSPQPNTTTTANIGEIATRGTNVTSYIYLTDTKISVSAEKKISSEMTILSYPMAIKDYIKVRIEVKQKDNGKYIAVLYIDGEKTEESIEMDVIPKISVIGKTFIGNEERFFKGSIQNAKIYYYTNNE